MSTHYQDLSDTIEALRRLSDAGDWQAAATLIGRLDLTTLPPATPADRELIEKALHSLQELDEKATWLRGDIARLLKRFDGQKQTG